MTAGEVELVTDLDCKNFIIENLGGFDPAPPDVVQSDDPRMSDKRSVPDGSVTDDSVSETAAIVQSKLNLNGNIPIDWVGHTPKSAAKGNLVEYVSNKDAISGYPGLDASALLDIADLPFTGPQAGTVTIIDMDFPDEFVPVASGTGAHFRWNDAPDNTWLGVNGPMGFSSFAGRPSLVTKQIPLGLIPFLDASKFATGTFALHRLPIVQGMGIGHAKGVVPDTGDGRTGKSNDTDYFGRDAKWHSVTTDKLIQPTVPAVNISFQAFYRGQVYIQMWAPLKGSVLFYRTSATITTGVYTQALTNPFVILVDPGIVINAYASRAGYNNSIATQFVAPTPPD